jgi:long-chain acyl-CoA synthetase
MEIRNLAQLHRRQAARFGPRTALRFRRHGLWGDLSWDDYLARSLACAATLAEAGIQIGDRVGLLAENRLEWLIADMGILAAGAVNVPAHNTLSAKQIFQQFIHAEISWLFVSTREQYDKIRHAPREIPGLRGMIVFDWRPGDEAGSWQGFLTRGQQVLDRHRQELDARCRRLGPDDLATIMYTSGTTGQPKGVMLSHDNLLSNALSMMGGTEVSEESVVLSWLPFSHIYGRLVDHYESMAAGCTLCLAESQDTLLQDIREIEPTCLSAVPRFYEKVLAFVGPVEVEDNRKKLRALFGRRIQWLNSGGAPLPLHIAEAYVRAGLTMLQGYGLTESSPVISFNRREANRLGTVGQAVPGVEIAIAPDGEVLSKGPHIMKGYWKNPEATAEVLKDGWLYTGDLGSLDAEGYLSITGRKKDLLVLSNGKKVIPTELEAVLLTDEYIDQALVYGEGKSFLTALIVPRYDKLRAALMVNEPGNARLVERADVHRFMMQRVQAALADVAAWEKVQHFILLPRPFTQEAEELTVSLKLRRGTIFQKHKDRLEALYEPRK